MAPGKRIDFIGTPLDLLTMRETLDRVEAAMRDRRRLQHVVVNVAKFVNMRSDAELRQDVLDSDVVGVDGAGIVAGCRLLGHGRVERVAGIDLMLEVLALCAAKGFRPYILGAKQDILERAIGRIRERHPRIAIAGYRNGYFSQEDEPEIVRDIAKSRADCLFVAMSSPAKERFLRRYRDELGVPFLMGVGGSIDVIAGYVRRAPAWVQKTGFEWAFRMLQEPRRLAGRYLGTNAVYAAILLGELLKQPLQRGSSA
jgi:N-acetylglucosaminyldiphosphoundecaprenol N-acetyl-beta-D-mannosaminyltransferase